MRKTNGEQLTALKKVLRQRSLHPSPGVSRQVSVGAQARGFTLVELLVSVAILTVISSIILVNYNQFGGTITLSNLTYEVALSIREAQTYGLLVRETTTGSSQFNIGYGVHFSSDLPTSYVIFSDLNNNGRYDGSSENVEIVTLKLGHSISSFCGRFSSGSEKCSPSAITLLDIVFRRPDPDALIKSDVVADSYGSARITLRSAHGLTRSISVASTGQIAVDQTSTTP